MVSSSSFERLVELIIYSPKRELELVTLGIGRELGEEKLGNVPPGGVNGAPISSLSAAMFSISTLGSKK